MNILGRFNYFASNLYGGLKESQNLLLRYPTRFTSKTMGEKMFSGIKVSLAAIAIPTSMYFTSGTSLSTESLLGALALGASFFMLRLKDNKHKNALGVPVAIALSAQNFLLGAPGFAIMAGVAATRVFTMAMIGDEKTDEKLRNQISLGYATAGIALVGAVAIKTFNAWEIIPLTSMLLGTLASSKINNKSHQSRACHVGGNGGNLLYASLYAGSAAAAMSAAVGLFNLATTIKENDIPQKTVETGRKLNQSEKIIGYISCLFNSDNKANYSFTKEIIQKPLCPKL